MARGRRLLMVSENGLYPDHFGGMEIRARDLVAHLRDDYDIALLTKKDLTMPDGSVTRLHIPRQVTTGRAWPSGRILRSVRNLPSVQSGRRHLRKSLAAFQPDLLYLHRFCSLHPVMVHELLHSGHPALCWFGDQHGAMVSSFASGSWPRRLVLRIGPLPPAARDRVTLVFNCEHLRRFYAPIVEGYAKQFVIYDGVDTRLFHPAAALPDPARFAFFGRVEPGKGFLAFCRTMALLPRSLIGGIDIIGDGPGLGDGLELLRLSGRSDLVRKAGFSRREAVPDRLRTASIVVHPSDEEGMPASVVEAMACGLPVVATGVGGTPEVVRHGETGLLVAPRDFGGLLTACRRLAESAELRRRMGANARTLVATRYDASMSFAVTERLIAEAIDGAGAPVPVGENHHTQGDTLGPPIGV